MRSFNKSEEAFQKALPLMPGGVNSPVRAFKSVDMNPVYMGVSDWKGLVL